MSRTLKAGPRNAPGRPGKRPQPVWIPPMLATLTDQFPTQGKWVFEPKLDGVRALIYIAGGAVRIFSRNQKPLNDAYPELVEALEPAVKGDAILDGEIVAFDAERGITSFSRLQQRMQLRDPVRARRSQVAVYLYLFDCLFYEGLDLTPLPLLDRKAVLREGSRSTIRSASLRIGPPGERRCCGVDLGGAAAAPEICRPAGRQAGARGPSGRLAVPWRTRRRADSRSFSDRTPFDLPDAFLRLLVFAGLAAQGDGNA